MPRILIRQIEASVAPLKHIGPRRSAGRIQLTRREAWSGVVEVCIASRLPLRLLAHERIEELKGQRLKEAIHGPGYKGGSTDTQNRISTSLGAVGADSLT